MAKKTKGKGKDEKIKRFLKNLPITPCLRKRDPMFCSVCIERNWEIAQYCAHAASEPYRAAPILKEIPAKKPEEEEVVKFKPIPKPVGLYKPPKPSPPVFKRKEKHKPKVLPEKRYVPKLEEGFFTKKFKMVAGIIIVITIILQSISLLSMCGAEDIKAPDADSDIQNELNNVLNEISSKSSDSEIAQDVETLYNSLDWNVYSVQKEDIGKQYTLNKESPQAVESLKIFNNTNLTEFLTTKGLDDFSGVAKNRLRRYYVFTYYQEHERIDEDGLVGTELLAQDYSLGSFIGPYGDLRTLEWNSVDVDGGGDDIKVRVNPNITGTVIPPHIDEGGMDIEIQRINDKSPIDIYFVKPSSYDDKTYIWVIGFHFSNLPSNFRFTAISEDIVEMTKGGLIGGYVETVNPPYIVDWAMDENVSEFKTIVGYANITWWTTYNSKNIPVPDHTEAYNVSEYSWTQTNTTDFMGGDRSNTTAPDHWTQTTTTDFNNSGNDVTNVTTPIPWTQSITDDFSGGNTGEGAFSNISWTHTTTNDFNVNCSERTEENIVIENDMVIKKNATPLQGKFISKSLDALSANAVLKDLSWNKTTPGASEIILIVEVFDNEIGWKKIWISADIDALPDWLKEIWMNMFGSLTTEWHSGRYFRYFVGFYGVTNKPQFEDITITVTSRGTRVDISNNEIKLAKYDTNIDGVSKQYYYARGTFISAVHDVGTYVTLESVSITPITIPSGTSISVWVTASGDNYTWLPWEPTNFNYAINYTSPWVKGRYFQYKVVLTTTQPGIVGAGVTPILDSITLSFSKITGKRVDTSNGEIKLAKIQLPNLAGEYYYPHGTFLSQVFDTESWVVLSNIIVNVDVPTGTSLSVWVEASGDNSTWIDWEHYEWCLVYLKDHYVNYALGWLNGRFFRYRVELSTIQPRYSTPRLYDITLYFGDLGIKQVNISGDEIKLEQFTINITGIKYYYPHGTFISVTHEVNETVVLSDITYTQPYVPAGTTLTISIQASETSNGENWKIWHPIYHEGALQIDLTDYTFLDIVGKAFRYKVELTGRPQATPILYDITFHFKTYLSNEGDARRVDTSNDEVKLATFTNLPGGPYYYLQGTFISKVNDTGYIIKFEDITVDYTAPLGTSIEIFFRTSANNTTSAWEPFVPVWSSALPQFNATLLKNYLMEKGRYVQYKILLTGTLTQTPVVRGITLHYSMNFGNLAEKCWVNAAFSPSPKWANLYYDDTDTTQTLNWQSECKTNLSCLYVADERLSAEINIESAPTNINILTEDFGTYSRTTYTASDSIPRLTYSCWERDVNRKTYLVLENIPTSFMVESTFKLPPETQNEIEPKESVVTTVLDYVCMQITASFSRIEIALRSITQTILSENNNFYLYANDYINIEFGVINNNQYITADGNFIAFLDSSISARMLEIKKLRAADQSSLEMITRGNRPLRILCVKGNDKTSIRISNLPENLNIYLSQDISYYTNTAVESVEVIHNGGNYLYANLSNISGFSMTRTVAGSQLNLNGNVDARVIMSSGIGVPQILNESYGDYLLFDQTQDSLSAALMMKNLQSISLGSKISVNFSSEKPLRLVYSNNSGLHGQMLIKDMPKTLTFTLGDFSVSLPEIYNPSLANMPNIISAFISPIDQMTLMIDSITQKFVGFSTEFNLSYEFSNSTTFIGNITQGALPDTDIKWTHGISLFREDDDISGKIYMTLPKKGDISLTEEDERIRVAFKFENYYPDYDWLLINITGDKEALIYIENITAQKINATIDVMPNLALPELHQYIDFSASNDLGNFYLRAKKEDSTIEMFLSEIPLQITASSVISNNSIIINYTSTKTVDYSFLNLTKECDGLRNMNVLIQEIPKTVNLKIERDIHIDPEKLSFGKMLPAINMSADSPAEIHIFLKRPETLSILQRAEEITIEGSVDQLFFALRDCSLSEDYKINELKIYAENINTVYVKFHFLFGKVPITELKSDGAVRVNIDYEFEVVGGGIKRSMVLCNVALLSLKIQENSIAISDSNTHYIIPAPMLSLGNWWIGIVALVGIMGAWSILLYKRIRQNK